MRSSDEILKKVRRIEISTRKIVDSMLSGQYHTRFKGQGMQFSEFREYYPGDDIRNIDWKVTARTQSAHIKKFEEERDLTVYIIADMSASLSFGSKGKTKSDALTEICALLCFAAIKNNDKVGLILFSDEVEKHVPPKKGRVHAMRIVSELLNFKPRRAKTNVKRALEFYRQVVKHSGVAFLASDFMDDGFEKPMRQVAKKHDLIGIRIQDPREKEVPPIGMLEMRDSETGELFWIDTSSSVFRQALKSRSLAFDKKLAATFNSAEVSFLDLKTDEDYFAKVVTFFKARKKFLRKK